MRVQTGNRGTLKMRKGPSQKSSVMASFANGTEVEILEVGDEWVKVKVGNKTGYMMVKFLEETEETTESNTEPAADTVTDTADDTVNEADDTQTQNS